ncbi:MAG: PQQ-binding-like beta-propeller repeat protein [FCB group bacterium]|nr:PQQ-binding-like beta-propeller repeat protein [FCB group bacterium]
MLKRLLIAVFVLGLVLTFTGTAFSGVNKDVVVKALPTYTGNPNGEAMQPKGYAPTPNRISPDKPKPQLVSDNLLQPPNPDTTGCEIQDHTDYANTSGYYGWAWYGDDPTKISMRFDVTEHHIATVYGAAVRIYDWTNTAGGCDLIIQVWDDAGGLPGNLLYTETVPASYIQANVPTNANYLFAFTTPVDVGYGPYHISIGVSGPAADYIMFGSDDGLVGTGRGSFFDGSDWYTNAAVLGGDDYNWRIASYACQAYSSCYIKIPPITDYNISSFPRTGYADGSVRDGMGERFVSQSPETLTVVDIWHYSLGDGTNGYYVGTNEANGVEVSVWGDNAGSIDYASGPLATVTVPAGVANLFPYTGDAGGWDVISVDFSSYNLVFRGAWHITAKMTSDDPADGQLLFVFSGASDGLSSGSVNYNPTEIWTLTGNSANWMAALWPAAFDIEPHMCKDEFSECQNQKLYGPNELMAAYGLPPYPGVAQLVKGLAINRVEDIHLQLISPTLFGDPATNPTIEVGIRLNNGGTPGPLVWADTLSGSQITYYPGWTDVVIPSSEQPQLIGDFFVSMGNISADPGTDYFYFGINEDAEVNGGVQYYSTYSGMWKDLGDATGGDENYMFDVGFCGIPFSEATCDPANDPGWSTFQGNQARTGASELAVGDAWCNLNLNWSYLDPTQSVNMTGPAIYGDKAVCSFTDHYIVFDIASGTPLYTLDGTFGDGQLIGGDIRNTPSIVNINIGGTPTDVMFIAGGSSNGIGAVDFNTGALIWQRTILSVGPSQMYGQTRFATFIVLNIGGVDVLFYSTENGKVAAVDAATGTLFNETNYPGIGWPDANNPALLTAATYVSGATDGTQLFYSTQTAATEGDVYAIDAATGAINWTLSSSGGLQAQNIYASYNYPEGFRGGVAYDITSGNLFAVSWANSGGASDFPTDGVYYTISAADGSLPLPASASPRAFYTTPIVDLNRVFCPTLSQWVNADIGGNLIAYKKSTGTPDWIAITADNAKYYVNGFRTCEPGGVDDLLFLFNENGFLECYNSVNGDQIFRRRIDHGGGAANIGMSGAIAMANGELHILFADYYGGLYDFTKGADRPRLQVVSYHPSWPVDFGSNPALTIDFGPIAENTGCTDLTFNNVLVDEAPISGSTLPDFSAGYVRDKVMATASKIADKLARDAMLSCPNSSRLIITLSILMV